MIKKSVWYIHKQQAVYPSTTFAEMCLFRGCRYESETPEHDCLQGEWSELTEMQRLLLVRSFRPDRIVFAASRSVHVVWLSYYALFTHITIVAGVHCGKLYYKWLVV